VYFSKLRLTPKGEQAAIRQRRRAEEAKRPSAEEAAEEVRKLMNEEK
jgi:hypothetical protein